MRSTWDNILKKYIHNLVSPDGRNTFESTPELVKAILQKANNAIAWNNADRTRSGYDFLFTWKASLKNVIIFKAKPSIFIDLSSVFVKNIIFICPPRAETKTLNHHYK